MTGPNVYKVDLRFKALGTGTADLVFAITTGQQRSGGSGEITPKDAALFRQDILGTPGGNGCLIEMKIVC